VLWASDFSDFKKTESYSGGDGNCDRGSIMMINGKKQIIGTISAGANFSILRHYFC